MTDIVSSVSSLQALTSVLSANPMARFSYTAQAYTDNNAAGVASYSSANEQNVPDAASTTVSDNVLDRGFRTQAASIPRMYMNHFIGRASYNLNKIIDFFNSFEALYKTDLAQNCNAYSAAASYALGDVCFQVIGTAHQVEFFVRTGNAGVTGTPPFDPSTSTYNTSAWTAVHAVKGILCTYLVDSQTKFDDWVNNVKTAGQDYTHVLIAGGLGGGTGGAYTLSSALTLSEAGTATATVTGVNGASVEIAPAFTGIAVTGGTDVHMSGVRLSYSGSLAVTAVHAVPYVEDVDVAISSAALSSGFYSCSGYAVQCTSSVTDTTGTFKSAGFDACSNLTRCSAVATGALCAGFNNCSEMHQCKGESSSGTRAFVSCTGNVDAKNNDLGVVQRRTVVEEDLATCVIDDQIKFNNWVNNVKNEGQDYTHIALIGGGGSSSGGAYEAVSTINLTTAGTKTVTGYKNPVIQSSADIAVKYDSVPGSYSWIKNIKVDCSGSCCFSNCANVQGCRIRCPSGKAASGCWGVRNNFVFAASAFASCYSTYTGGYPAVLNTPDGGFNVSSPTGVFTQSNRNGGKFYTSAYGGGTFIAGGDVGLYYSTNGITWTQSNRNGGNFYTSAYGGGTFIAGSNQSNAGLYYSTDGITWTQSSITRGSFNTSAYGGGTFIAGGDAGLYYSKNGITWTQSNRTSGNFGTSAYGGSTFIAGSGINAGLYYSTDGITWTQSNVTSGGFGTSAYGGGTFIAGSLSNAGLYYSTDGITWTQSNRTSGNFRTVAYGGGTFIAGGDAGLYYSKNGITWTQSNITRGDLFTSAYGGGPFIAGGGSNQAGLYYSPDGITWAQSNIASGDFRTSAYGGGTFIAGSYSGAGLYYSIVSDITA